MKLTVQTICDRISMLKSDQSGATSIEYGLLASLIAVSAITALDNLGATLSDTFTNVSTELAQASGGADEEPGTAASDTTG